MKCEVGLLPMVLPLCHPYNFIKRFILPYLHFILLLLHSKQTLSYTNNYLSFSSLKIAILINKKNQ